jgi:SanA protein
MTSTRKKRIFFITLITIATGTLIMTYTCNKIITDYAEGKLYTDAKTIPYNRVGLLLGTNKYISRGHYNPYYYYRIIAATELIHEQKIKYIIVSGDNGETDYNEPWSMRKDLIKAGVDSSIIYMDFAGFRTFDSMVRLKDIFGQDSVTVISQSFHNERAIYIAYREGIHAIGYNAADVGGGEGFRTQLREKFARVKVFLDFWFGKEPKFLGAKVTIPE